MAAVIAEGPIGFWPEHTRNMWGNQIWFDLLLSFGVAWTLIVPRARALNMRPAVWLIAIIMSGSIGLLAVFSRVLFLEKKSKSREVV